MLVGYDDYLEPDGRITRGLVKFNLAALPDRATINAAQLWLYLTSSWDYEGEVRRITTYRVTSPWAEDIVNWQSAPALAEAYGHADVQHDEASTGKWYAFDVTQLVRAWHNGAYTNYGIALRGPEHSGGDSSWKAFATGETPYGPELVVDFTPSVMSSLSLSPMAHSEGAATLLTGRAEEEDFGLGVSPHAQVVERGDVATYTLSLTATEPLAGLVTLGMTSTPSGPVGSFTSNPVSPPATVSMTVPTQDLEPDQYSLLISGTSGEITHTAAATLTVQQSSRVYLPVVHKQYRPDVDSGVVFLFVGIADYLYMEPPSFGARAGAPGYDILFSVCDAENLSGNLSICGCPDVLASQLFGSRAATGCPLDNMLVLTDSRATKAAIRDAIVNWLDERETRNTTVFIHFSGHGAFGPDVVPFDEADGYDEYLAPYELLCDPCGDTPESTMWIMETAIRDDELAAWLDDLESQRIILAIDSCFSGGLIESSAGMARSLSLRQIESPSAVQAGDGLLADVGKAGRVVLTASTEVQGSWEFGGLKNGAFSYYLAQALVSHAADRNSNGLVSAEEAFAYLAPRVDSYVYGHTGDAPGGPYHQNPQLYDGIAGEIDLTQPVAVTICPAP
jgi:hypothetical protein